MELQPRRNLEQEIRLTQQTTLGYCFTWTFIVCKAHINMGNAFKQTENIILLQYHELDLYAVELQCISEHLSNNSSSGLDCQRFFSYSHTGLKDKAIFVPLLCLAFIMTDCWKGQGPPTQHRQAARRKIRARGPCYLKSQQVAGREASSLLLSGG